MEKCCCFSSTTKNQSTVNKNIERPSVNSSSENEIIIAERSYGCFGFGVLVACLIVLILIIGIVPAFFTIHDNRIILLIVLITLIIVGIMVFVYFMWQHKKAKQQREISRRTWNQQNNPVRRQNVEYKSISTSSRTSWLFWSFKTKKINTNTMSTLPSSSSSSPPPPPPPPSTITKNEPPPPTINTTGDIREMPLQQSSPNYLKSHTQKFTIV